MKSKGFTLIEILVVISVLAILSLIAIPAVKTTINNSKEKSRNIIIMNMKDAAKLYLYDNFHIYENSLSGNGICVNIDLLKDKYLENELIDPTTGEEFSGCIRIIKSNNDGYSYEFESDLIP